MHYIDSLLNKITMYRLVLYGLITIVVWALLMSLVGQLSYNPLFMLGSLGILLLVCFISNYLIARIVHAPTNIESWGITALILFLTLAPFLDGYNALYIAGAGVAAMASKYVFAIKKRHVFNPAAFALFALSLSGIGLATWWVASPVMLPLVLILGLLIVRKIRRFDTFVPFFFVAATFYIAGSLIDGASVQEAASLLILSGPILFLGTIMLTEPFTMPPSRPLRIVYGALVGLLFATHFSFGPLYSTPQLALLVGNLYAFFVGSRQRLLLTLERVEERSSGVYEYIFRASEKLRFVSGQYLEWTLPHPHSDSRGNRRYLSISSSPTEDTLRFATRIGEKSSSFKKALKNLNQGTVLTAASLGGDFVLPRDNKHPLVFIAGGIGITPFASMLRYMLDQSESRDVTLLYAANTANDFSFREVIEAAKEKCGVKPVYLAGERITEVILQNACTDLSKPFFYISGPDMMVRSYKAMLTKLGVPRAHIKTDYFPGL